MNVFFIDPVTGRTCDTAGFGIIIQKAVIADPEIRASGVQIPGMDGVLDTSEIFGRPQYGNRQITIDCGATSREKGMRFWQEAAFRNALHGRKLQIVFDRNPEHYFLGRVSVGPVERAARMIHFQITADCYPWKLRRELTEVKETLTNAWKTVTLRSERMPTTPTVTATRETAILFGDKSFTVPAGVSRVWDLQLTAPENELRCRLTSEASGTITFTYQEGSF